MPVRARRKRYLFYNLVLWAATTVVAAVSLFGLRHYGNAFAARHGAYHMLEQAQEAIERGNYDVAQSHIAESLKAYPEGLRDVMVRFGSSLTLMPVAEDALEQSLEMHAVEANAADRASTLRFQMLFGRGLPDDMRTALDLPTSDPETAFWRGRWCMCQGMLQEAWSHFDAYWRENETVRREIVARLDTSTDDASDSGKAFLLLDMGLWREAAQAGARLPEGPDRDALEGFAALVEGNRQSAAAHFRDALRQRPNHFYAQLGFKHTMNALNPVKDPETPKGLPSL